MGQLSREALEHVADYFKALAEPTRLQILSMLQQEELSVGDLAERCGCTSANISRHLAVLSAHHLVARTARGTSAFYRIADPAVHALCDLVCGSIARRFEHASRASQSFARPAAGQPRSRSLKGEKQ